MEAQQYILSNEIIRNEIRAEMCEIEADQSYTSTPKVKVKASEVPKFDGNLRECPSFREDFDHLVKCLWARPICSKNVSDW